jgi:hypothetical protein
VEQVEQEQILVQTFQEHLTVVFMVAVVAVELVSQQAGEVVELVVEETQ